MRPIARQSTGNSNTSSTRSTTAILESIPEGVVVVGADGAILYANPGFSSMVRVPIQEIVGGRMSRFVAVKDVPRFCQLALHVGAPRRASLTLTPRNGKALAVQFSISAYDSEAPGSICVVVTNIAEQRRRQALASDSAVKRVVSAERAQSQAALWASEERFRRAFDLGLVGMALTSSTKECLEVNDELCRILGYTREELLNTTWLEITHPDDIAADVAEFEQVMAGDTDSYSLEKRWIHKDGHIVDSIMAVRCVRDDDGEVSYFICLVQDITERKQAEAELRRSEANLAEAQRLSQTGSWAWNVTTGELFWSNEHYRICGVDPETFVVTQETSRQLMHPQDRDAVVRALEGARQQKADFDYEFRMIRPDESIRWVHSRAHPVCAATGEVIEFVGTVVDLTERKEADQERTRLLRGIMQAQEDERRRIALEMHDQFGQHLSALVIKLATLQRELGPETPHGRQLALLETAARQLDGDLELIVWRLRPPALDDLGLVAALTHYIERWSDDFHIRAELHTSGFEQQELTSEVETSLYRITQEALTNVVKHAQAKNVAVLLSRSHDLASLIVEDDGVGFAAEAASRRQRAGIRGMRERAGLLGGTVDVESKVGRGTTVVVRIPVAVDSSREAV
jgi:PAS domain S-box-containing protein